ncbi:MAG: hypothetical protein WCJ01_07185 [Ignavibacteria bacterium]
MEKFQNKYRIPSARLPYWDYGNVALYFITICTHRQIDYFGKIVVGTQCAATDDDDVDVETQCIASLPQPPPPPSPLPLSATSASATPQTNRIMQLSEIGKIMESEWLKTFELRPDMNLYMGEFVVMPNHFHAIIGIGENIYNTGRRGDCDCGGGDDDCRDAMHCVSTPTATTPTTTATNETINKFGPQSKNLASIVRGFKSSVTVATHKINPKFEWQSRYHDHIIRNDESFNRITNYIIHNPENWQDDKFFQQ